MEYRAFSGMSIGELCGKEHPCACGKTHAVSTLKAYPEGSSVQQLLASIHELLPSGSVLFVTDEDVYELYARKFEKMIARTHSVTLLLYPKSFLPSVSACSQAVSAGEEHRLIVSYGGAGVTDAAKYAAEIRGLPLVSMGSSPSADSYLAPYSELYFGKVKKRVASRPPAYFIWDTEAVATAPASDAAAGFGTVCAKSVALFDLGAAQALSGEPLCENICALLENCVSSVLNISSGLQRGNREALAELCRNLMRCGLAAQLCGGDSLYGGETQLALTCEMLMRSEGLAVRQSGENLMLCAELAARMYKLYFETSPPDLFVPPDTAAHARMLAGLFGLSERPFLEAALGAANDGELLVHKLSEYRADFRSQSLALAERMHGALMQFKKLYADAGYWIRSYLPSSVPARAAVLGPLLFGRYTLLLALRGMGCLELPEAEAAPSAESGKA